MLVTCNLERQEDALKIKPFPGGQEARRQGCCCPYQPIPDCTVTFNSECKVHELENVLKN